MSSSGISAEGELRGQPANPGSPGKIAVKTDWFHGFYPARVRKSLALKTLVSAAD